MNALKESIEYLLRHNHIKTDIEEYSFDLFRSLMNITMPDHLDDSFYKLQDEIIKNEYSKKKIVGIDSASPLEENILLYRGDITLLKVDAIVNACNNKLLGCFVPLHHCIDNAIHSYAGLQVRRDLIEVMERQGHDEENGKVKVTKGYNLPSKYIFHTVGPIIYSKVTSQDIEDLKNCYISCLEKAVEMNLDSIAFPCISTGEYHFDNALACDIAFETVQNFLKSTAKPSLKVIFITFTEHDFNLYQAKGRSI